MENVTINIGSVNIFSSDEELENTFAWFCNELFGEDPTEDEIDTFRKVILQKRSDV